MTNIPEVETNRRKKTGGRKKGTPNKTTAQLKDAILMALDDVGGVQYLAGLAHSHPPAFAALLGRVLPMTVSGDPDNPLMAGITVTFK